MCKMKKINAFKLPVSFFFSVFFFLLLFDLSVLVNVGGFFVSNLFLVLLVLDFQSVFGGLIDILPHLGDDFGQFGDFGIGILWLYFVVNLLSEKEECGQGSFWWSGLYKLKSTLSSICFLPIIYIAIF